MKTKEVILELCNAYVKTIEAMPENLREGTYNHVFTVLDTQIRMFHDFELLTGKEANELFDHVTKMRFAVLEGESDE